MADRVSIREAAQRLGVSQDTIRRRLRRGELVADKEPTPQGHVWLIELPDDAPAPSEVTERAAPAGEVRRLEEMITLLRDEIVAQRVELEARRREVAELHALLEQAQRALAAPPRESEPIAEPIK